MSYIADIKALYETLYPNGVFLFSSEVRADDFARNMDAGATSFFVIDDQPLNTTTVINQDAGATDSPRPTVYVLTNLDIFGGQVKESNTDRFYQHEQCVEPMKDIAIRVLGQYFRSGSPVQRQAGTKPTFNITDKYNLWSKMLYGVQVNVSNLNLSRRIDYCANQPEGITFVSTDVPVGDYIPLETDTISE